MKLYGVLEKEEGGREDCEGLVLKLIRKYMPDRTWPEDLVERANHLGPRQHGQRPRPLVAKMLRWVDAVKILGHRSGRNSLKEEQVHMSQDLMKKQQGKLREMRVNSRSGYFHRGKLYERENPPQRLPQRPPPEHRAGYNNHRPGVSTHPSPQRQNPSRQGSDPGQNHGRADNNRQWDRQGIMI
ncbi:hypothetical protein ACOMHN_012347 [Nucella lapillus]